MHLAPFYAQLGALAQARVVSHFYTILSVFTIVVYYCVSMFTSFVTKTVHLPTVIIYNKRMH